MRIVSVSHYYTPHVGGLEIVAAMQAQSLTEYGHEITVVTCASAGETSGWRNEGAVAIYRARALNIFDRLFSIPFPIGGIGLIETLWSQIRHSQVVQIHDVFYVPSWFACFFAWVFRKPLLITQHVAMVPHTSRIIMAIQRIVYATAGTLLFSYAEKIVVYNPSVRKFLLQRGIPTKKIVLAHNGIDTQHFCVSIPRDVVRKTFGLPLHRKLVLFVGRLVPKKGYDILFAARDASFDLVYVGSGNVPPMWEQMPNFHFLGTLNQDQLAELYQAVDLFVFPATGEMFTLVMQEAMASGLPIIATDEPGYAAYAINRKLLILCERKVAVLKTEILRVLGDASLMRSMSEYSRELSKHYFDWHTNFKVVSDIYKNLDTPSLT